MTIDVIVRNICIFLNHKHEGSHLQGKL